MGFKKMTTDVPLYNSRIIKSYIEYLSKYYPSIDIDEIFNSAGMTKYNVNDPGHWFSQRQVDRFYEALVKITGNPGIAKDAGRFLASSEGLGPVKQCILGLINPMSLYMLMGKIYPMLSHAATIDTKKFLRRKLRLPPRQSQVLKRKFTSVKTDGDLLKREPKYLQTVWQLLNTLNVYIREETLVVISSLGIEHHITSGKV